VSVFLIIYITIYISDIYKDIKRGCTPHFLIVTTVTVTLGVFYLFTFPLPGQSIILHGAAMEGAVLADDGAAVDADNLVVGECLADDTQGLGVEVGLSIGRDEYSAVDDQIVGIGGWQAVAVVVDGAGKGQL
jgi:hypothetical protein